MKVKYLVAALAMTFAAGASQAGSVASQFYTGETPRAGSLEGPDLPECRRVLGRRMGRRGTLRRPVRRTVRVGGKGGSFTTRGRTSKGTLDSRSRARFLAVNTPEDRAGRGAQARKPVGSPGGDGRRVEATRRGAGDPQGGEKPRRGNGPTGRRNNHRTGTDPGHVEPRGRARGSSDDGTARTAAAPRAGGQRRGGDGPRRGVPTGPGEQTPEGRKPTSAAA